ncbi:MAG TPA: HD domain-containing protein [Gemmataceae bacterium]|jgi:3'-5' exoribonuclease|nr:HD domain-containing protein [Gemmataceae bacterium]
MTRRSVQLLVDGENLDEVYLVTDKQLRANKNGNLYLQVELRDRTGAISARMWNASEPHFRGFEEGDFLRIKGKVQLFQGSLQVIFTQMERQPADQVNLADFLPRTEQDVGRLFERMRTLLLRLENPHLRALAECFLMDAPFVDAFCKVPAGIRNHHAYLGGLLEHVVTLLEGADRLAPLYPEINRDLLLMGIFLHDIGKVRELSFDRVFGYTDEGQLLGHIVIAVQMLDEKVARVPDLTGEPFPTETLLRLKHMILSHHGSYEFGSPRLPMTPEAIALHHLDNFDAKVHSFTRDIREDRNGSSAWTPYSQATQRRLFKGLQEASGLVTE